MPFLSIVRNSRLRIAETKVYRASSLNLVVNAILDIGPIAERSFRDWSMGFVGHTDLRVGLGAAASVSEFDISLLSGQEIYGVLHALMLRNEGWDRAA